MITLIQGANRAYYPYEIDAMHRLRAQVFHERLGWDAKVENGWETDEYDDLNPLYLISEDDHGEIRGAVRLLPTTGPNMLADVFSDLLPDGQAVRSATIWGSRSWNADEGARPSSSPSIRRKRSARRRASPWRPERWRASISCSQNRSRRG
jgi:acyl homoserine lactone synthase